jgi:hypothetical protein
MYGFGERLAIIAKCSLRAKSDDLADVTDKFVSGQK